MINKQLIMLFDELIKKLIEKGFTKQEARAFLLDELTLWKKSKIQFWNKALL